MSLLKVSFNFFHQTINLLPFSDSILLSMQDTAMPGSPAQAINLCWKASVCSFHKATMYSKMFPVNWYEKQNFVNLQ